MKKSYQLIMTVFSSVFLFLSCSNQEVETIISEENVLEESALEKNNSLEEKESLNNEKIKKEEIEKKDNNTTTNEPKITETVNKNDKNTNTLSQLTEKKETFYVKTTKANVRLSPGTDAKVISYVQYGDKVISTHMQLWNETPWYKIIHNDQEVWISSTVVQTEKIEKPQPQTTSTKIMTYDSNTLKITIKPVFTDQLRYWISTITVKNINQVNSAFAGKKDVFSTSIKEPTSTIAKRNGAILAINGAAAGFNNRSYVIRDGIIHRASQLDEAPLEFRKDGTLFIGYYGQRSAEQMIKDGTIHTFDYGPVLLRNGQTPDYASQSWFKNAREPRTAIGQRKPFEYIILTVDGRSKLSRGMSYMEMVNVFRELGVTQAYALDGGGSTTLYFDGKVINHPSDSRERPYSDILYFN